MDADGSSRIAHVGFTNSFGAELDSDGFYNSMMFSTAGSHDRFHLDAPFQGNLGISNFYGDPSFFNDDYHDPRVGHWLVRTPAPPAAVPEPATLPILAASLLSLPFLARRRMGLQT